MGEGASSRQAKVCGREELRWEGTKPGGEAREGQQRAGMGDWPRQDLSTVSQDALSPPREKGPGGEWSSDGPQLTGSKCSSSPQPLRVEWGAGGRLGQQGGRTAAVEIDVSYSRCRNTAATFREK